MDRLLIAALVLSMISVSRAEKFVLKGSSVRLDVEGYERIQFYEFVWHWNPTGKPARVVVKYVHEYDFHTLVFKNGMEFDRETLSLLLKNAAERDGGTYTAIITEQTTGAQRTVASYRLTVQEAPPTPQLSLSSTGGSCNVSVNCSAGDTWATYTCDRTYCRSGASAASSTGVRINVTATGSTVRCSSSNGVGMETRSEDIFSRAEKFMLKGSSVHLDVEGYERIQFYKFVWHWNPTGRPSRVVVKYVYEDDFLKSFKNGMEFDRKNFSLLLKNAAERDGGTYTAFITEDGGARRTVACYRLTVQEAPPTPQLSLSSAGGSCNVSVNCSAGDTWATYTCDRTYCRSGASAASSTGVRINVTATSGTVRCSSSNGVGMETRSEDIFSRAEKFMLKGSSVHLDVEGYERIQFYKFVWHWIPTGKPSRVVVKYVYEDDFLWSFKNGMEFDRKNFSLLLKNAAERDSGTYTAIITEDGGARRTVACYRLTVQEAPPTPQLSLSSTGGSCNVSVNCSAGDTWATYTCDRTYCRSGASAASSTGVRINVTATGSTVRCSSSNGVGMETRSEDIFSRAEKFMLKGSSVHLDVEGYERIQFYKFVWHWNPTGRPSRVVVKYVHEDDFHTLVFKNGMEFDRETLSLLLKNAAERDGGTYTAIITEDGGARRTVACYRLTVQEAPPTPQLSLSSTGGSCNVSVNCSAGDTWATYTCDRTYCRSGASAASSKGVRINVTATGSTVRCSSSNGVGMETRSEDIFSRAEKFMLKGSSVHLDVEGYERIQFYKFVWHWNPTGRPSRVVVKYVHEDDSLKSFKNGMEFDRKNFSLLLKNAAERDSGTYTAIITEDGGARRTVACYRLTVQEAPPTPQLSLSSAGGSCNVSVNCSAGDTWATYTCDRTYCRSGASAASSTGVRINVTATSGTVRCSSSNGVGMETRSEDICPPNDTSNSLIASFAIIIFTTTIVVIIFIFLAINQWRRSGSKRAASAASGGVNDEPSLSSLL